MTDLIIAIIGIVIVFLCAVIDITLTLILEHRLKEFEQWVYNARNWHEE